MTTFWYKDKPYGFVEESKIKVDGEWKDVIIYRCHYNNPDGMIWVRFREEFFRLFEAKDSNESNSGV